MSDKEEIREQLSAYLDGELSESEARRITAALAEDPGLTAELEGLRATRDVLRNLPRLRAGADFAAKVMQEADLRGLAGRSAAPGSRKTPPRWLRYCAAAAVVVVALGAGLVMSRLLYEKIGRPPVVSPNEELLATDTRELGEVAREFKKETRPETEISGDLDSSVAEEGFATKMKESAPVRKGADGVAFDSAIRDEKLAMKKEPPTPVLHDKADAKGGESAHAGVGAMRSKGSRPAGAAGTNGFGDDYAGKAPETPHPASKAGGGRSPRIMSRKGPSEPYDELSKFDEAQDRTIDKLASLSRKVNNEIIFTDNMKTEQKNVEKILLDNGFEIAPPAQLVVISNQAINLNNNMEYNRKMNRAPVSEVSQVEYMVIGNEKQLVRLRRELRTGVGGRQRVSQLPESSYHRALWGVKKVPGTLPVAVKPTPAKFAAKDSRDTKKDKTSLGQVAQTQAALPSALQEQRSKKATSQRMEVAQQPLPRGRPQMRQRERRISHRAMLITLNYRRPVTLNRIQRDAIKQAEAETKLKIKPPRPNAAKSQSE